MAKAISNIQFGDKDGNVQMFPAGATVPDEVLKALNPGSDFAVDEPLEFDLEGASESDATIEIAPGISAPNPKLMTEDEAEDFDEDGFRSAVESIRSRPLTATSGEPSYGRIPNTEADNGFLTSNNQRLLNAKHREVVKKVRQAEKDRVPVGSAVAGQDPKVRASKIAAGAAGAAGFRRPGQPQQTQRDKRAAQRAGTANQQRQPQETAIEREQRELRERQARESGQGQGGNNQQS